MNDLSRRKGRYGSIDFLKGIACIAVVLIHIQFPGRVGFAVRQVCRFAVPFFFCISGFFFPKPDKQLETTARKLRHAALLLFGAMLFHLIVCGLGLGGISLRAYVRGFLSGTNLLHFFLANPPYQWPHLWFLGALVYIYLFALVWFGDGKRFWSAGPMGVVLLVGMVAFQEFAEYLPFRPLLPIVQVRLCVLFMFRGLPFFLLGIWLRSREETIRRLQISIPIAAILVATGAFLAVLEAKWTVNSQFYIGNYLMVAGMFLWAVWNPSAGYRPLEFVGRNLSMPVYVIHIIVGKWVGFAFRHAGIASSVAVHWVTPCLVILMSLALATVFHVITARIRRAGRYM